MKYEGVPQFHPWSSSKQDSGVRMIGIGARPGFDGSEEKEAHADGRRRAKEEWPHYRLEV